MPTYPSSLYKGVARSANGTTNDPGSYLFNNLTTYQELKDTVIGYGSGPNDSTTVLYNSAAKYPTDVNVGVENISTQTHFVNDFASMLNTLEYEILAIQTSMASMTGIGASFVAASNSLSIRNLKSKADKYVFELKRLRGDIDRMNTTGFPGNDIVGMGLTSVYPSGRNRGWGPN
jgi:hypothetical protein